MEKQNINLIWSPGTICHFWTDFSKSLFFKIAMSGQASGIIPVLPFG